MCGRYSLTNRAFVEKFNLGGLIPDLKPRYNIAPTQAAPVVRAGERGREVQMMRWGLVPSWADDPKIGNRLINSRSEEADRKPAFRAAFRRRRCLVPADGFYEWKQGEGSNRKQPYRILMKDGEPFAFAGLWEHWRSEAGDELDTFTVLTTEPNELVAPIHNRMPVILPESAYDRWLDPGTTDAEQLKPLLRPFPAEQMDAYPVDPRVNRPQNDDPFCIRPSEQGGLW